ncbi:MAG: LIC11966 family surface protein [Flammeovirgaceae bacterium]
MGNQTYAQTFNNALEYLEYISNEYSQIYSAQWEYTKAIAHNKNAKKVDKRRQELLGTIKTAQKKVYQMPAYDGDADFKNFVGKHLNINYSIVNDDYAKIVDMEAVAEQSYDLMEAYLLAKKLANQKLSDAADKMNEKMEGFATKHRIQLVETESKIGENMKIASKVFDYHNAMYLIFFKSYMQEANFLQALNTQDVNAMEQAKNALGKYSLEGLTAAAKLSHYNNDASLFQACNTMLKFYQDEAKNQLPKLIDFYLKQENLEKIKTSFNKIPQSKRTQADVDKYNKAIDEFNKSVGNYNEINNGLNQKRAQLINTWNKAAAAFLNKHVP